MGGFPPVSCLSDSTSGCTGWTGNDVPAVLYPLDGVYSSQNQSGTCRKYGQTGVLGNQDNNVGNR